LCVDESFEKGEMVRLKRRSAISSSAGAAEATVGVSDIEKL